MTDENRIERLEQELAETRWAAADMLSDTILALIKAPEQREEMAQRFASFADAPGADSVKSGLARLTAEAIRRDS